MPKAIRALLLLLVAQALACQAWAVAIELRPALLAAPLTERLARVLAQGQILLSFFVLAAILRRHSRWRWLGGFTAVYGFTLAAESAGVGLGVLFGAYYFTDMLGFQWFGLVPALIPLAWFNIAVPSFVAASLAFPSRAGRVIGGASLMLAWDLCADPVVGRHYPFWIWHDPGGYYGIPLSNFASWFLIGLLAMASLDRLSWTRVDEESGRPFLAHYGASLFMALGLALIYRMGLAVLLCSALLLAVQGGRRLGWAGK